MIRLRLALVVACCLGVAAATGCDTSTVGEAAHSTTLADSAATSGPAVGAAAPTTSAVSEDTPSAAAVTSERNAVRQIAFVKNGGSAGDSVWLMNSDGSEPHLLADKVGTVGQLSWSRDGSQLAIISAPPTSDIRFNCSQVWVVAADGSNLRRIELEYPADNLVDQDSSVYLNGCGWSPDGDTLALSAYIYLSPDIYNQSRTAYAGPIVFLLSVSSGEMRSLCVFGGPDANVGSVSWNGDGTTILLTMEAYSTASLYPYDIQTGEELDEVQIDVPAGSGTGVDNDSPFCWMFTSDGTYSPDMTRLVCVRRGSNASADKLSPNYLVIARANGSSARALLQMEEFIDSPTWSPDGLRLAFAHGPGNDVTHDAGWYAGWHGRQHISVVSVSGGDPVDIGEGLLPAWRPSPSTTLIAELERTRDAFIKVQERAVANTAEVYGALEALQNGWAQTINQWSSFLFKGATTAIGIVSQVMSSFGQKMSDYFSGKSSVEKLDRLPDIIRRYSEVIDKSAAYKTLDGALFIKGLFGDLQSLENYDLVKYRLTELSENAAGIAEVYGSDSTTIAHHMEPIIANNAMSPILLRNGASDGLRRSATETAKTPYEARVRITRRFDDLIESVPAALPEGFPCGQVVAELVSLREQVDGMGLRQVSYAGMRPGDESGVSLTTTLGHADESYMALPRLVHAQVEKLSVQKKQVIEDTGDSAVSLVTWYAGGQSGWVRIGGQTLGLAKTGVDAGKALFAGEGLNVVQPYTQSPLEALAELETDMTFELSDEVGRLWGIADAATRYISFCLTAPVVSEAETTRTMSGSTPPVLTSDQMVRLANWGSPGDLAIRNSMMSGDWAAAIVDNLAPARGDGPPPTGCLCVFKWSRSNWDLFDQSSFQGEVFFFPRLREQGVPDSLVSWLETEMGF